MYTVWSVNLIVQVLECYVYLHSFYRCTIYWEQYLLFYANGFNYNLTFSLLTPNRLVLLVLETTSVVHLRTSLTVWTCSSYECGCRCEPNTRESVAESCGRLWVIAILWLNSIADDLSCFDSRLPVAQDTAQNWFFWRLMGLYSVMHSLWYKLVLEWTGQVLLGVKSQQWLNYSKLGGGTRHLLLSLSLPSPSFPFPLLPLSSLPIEVGPLNPARRSGWAL